MRALLTRAAVAAATAAVSLGFLVGTTAPASAAGCTTKHTSYSTVKAGKKGSKAGAVECLLRQAGYLASHDRSFSKADAKKLSAFQGAHALEATGRTNGATWSALVAQGPTPALQPATVVPTCGACSWRSAPSGTASCRAPPCTAT